MRARNKGIRTFNSVKETPMRSKQIRKATKRLKLRIQRPLIVKSSKTHFSLLKSRPQRRGTRRMASVFRRAFLKTLNPTKCQASAMMMASIDQVDSRRDLTPKLVKPIKRSKVKCSNRLLRRTESWSSSQMLKFLSLRWGPTLAWPLVQVATMIPIETQGLQDPSKRWTSIPSISI